MPNTITNLIRCRSKIYKSLKIAHFLIMDVSRVFLQIELKQNLILCAVCIENNLFNFRFTEICDVYDTVNNVLHNEYNVIVCMCCS